MFETEFVAHGGQMESVEVERAQTAPAGVSCHTVAAPADAPRLLGLSPLLSRGQDRVFAVTAARIWLTYRIGSFRYVYFVWQ